MNLRAGRRTDVSPGLQAFWLKRLFPDSAVRLRAQHLVWTGRVTPLPSCETYTLRLEAEPAMRPLVYVTEPALVPNEAGNLPHVYDDGSLCLAEPGDWQRHMLYVDTYVPWALEWLVHYELWRSTGTWHGDGADRTDRASQERILHPYSERPPSRTRPSSPPRPQKPDAND